MTPLAKEGSATMDIGFPSPRELNVGPHRNKILQSKNYSIPSPVIPKRGVPPLYFYAKIKIQANLKGI